MLADSQQVDTRVSEFLARVLERAEANHLLISAESLGLLETYYQLLAQWNDKINLTGIRLAELSDQGIDRLFIEPLAAARFFPETAIDWFDIGSGGGSPALPLKIVHPVARLTMVESKVRKAAFLREAVRSLALRDALVENATAAEIAGQLHRRQSADVVTVRALKIDAALLDAASTLLRSGGRLLLFRSGIQPEPPQDTRLRVVETTSLGTARIMRLQRTDFRLNDGQNANVPRGTI
jgi:16S rRNA (guanine527-N7)-methyltransferase